MEKTVEQIELELCKPFTITLEDGTIVPDLKWRVQSTFENSEKKHFAEIAPYITASQVKQRLRESVGSFNFDMSYEEMASANGMICNLNVKGSSKSGVGTCFKKHPDIDPDKTKESDSLKRAAIGFGIGAYIKDIKNITLPYNKSKKCALTSDGKTELLTPEMLSAYINGISIALLNLNSALKSLDKDILEANKKEIGIVWNLIKNK